MANGLNWKQQSIRLRHAIANLLGWPVDYEPFEFRHRKERLDWSRIPEERIRLLSGLFNTPEEQVRLWVTEAEALQAPEKEDPDQEWFAGVGSPMGRTDRITLYTAVRAFQPECIVETGTGAGSAALYMLTAMEKNEKGRLLSIDATPDPRHIGCLVPERLKPRMTTYSGKSLDILPQLTGDAKDVDFFLHESSHTYAVMTAEFEWAFKQIKGRGVITSHDVLMTNAWDHFVKRHDLSQNGMVKNLGLVMV